MAQWRREERTLHAKIVYYGPSMGGKTANLEALQRMLDARGAGRLLSTQTTNDRTLFFDLLTVELRSLLGYRVSINVYTVPGQVRYDTARQIVLSGADAIVFVADSSVGREEQNRWSIQNLQLNMRARRLDSARVPLLYQFNKQDMPDAAEPQEVGKWLRAPDGVGIAAVATEGRGVLETFEAAIEAMLGRLIAQADEELLRGVDTRDFPSQLKLALAPIAARRDWEERSDEGQQRSSTCRRAAMAAKGEDLLQDSIRTSAKLGEWYSAAAVGCWRSGREADAYRKLIALDYGAGTGLDRQAITDAHLGAVADGLEARIVSLVRQPESGQIVLERIWGGPDDPLLESAWGRRALRRMTATSRATTIEDLRLECEDAEARTQFKALRSLAAIPVGARGDRFLLAYAALPDGRFSRRDIRFLTAAAVHLGAALARADRLERLAGESERLEAALERLSSRLSNGGKAASDLRYGHAELLQAIPEGSEEILADAMAAACSLRDKRIQGRKRAEALESIIEAIEMQQGQLRQISEQGARFREQLDAFLHQVSGPGSERPAVEDEQERETEREVLNVG
jgi:signal recognition particle receptor subunit beta